MPDEPAEARLLRTARESHRPRKLSMREAARRAGLSESHWRHVEAGYELKGGHRIPVKASAGTLARMASATGVTPAQLRDAGRDDAAALLAEAGELAETGVIRGLAPAEVELVEAFLQAVRSRQAAS